MQSSPQFSQLLASKLDPEKSQLIRSVGQLASEIGINIFLVGGAVRDLIIGRPIEDLDLVVEGDAEDIAYQIAKRLSGRVISTSKFSTAKLKVDGSTLDLVTARREYYPQSGALPEVMPGTIKDDLERRDFSINTLAFPIHDLAAGEIINEFGGLEDIRDSLVRVLHDKSFRDDPTRMIRAIRYEKRLGFKIEFNTQNLLVSHAAMLRNVTGNRIRNEMANVLKESEVGELLLRLHSVGILGNIHPALEKALGTLEDAVDKGIEKHLGEQFWVGLLSYSMTSESFEELIDRLGIPGRCSKLVRELASLKKVLSLMENSDISPVEVYDILYHYDPTVIKVCIAAEKNRDSVKNVIWFQNIFPLTKPFLNGKDLLLLGVAEGPDVGRMLARLRRAKVLGSLGSKSDEIEFVRSIIPK